MPSPHKFNFVGYLYRGRNEREYEVTVEYSVTPFVPARLYGDYPQPAEGGEIEIISVKYQDAEFDTTRDEDDRIQEWCEDRCEQDLAEWFADAEEYRAEMRRDALFDEPVTIASESTIPARAA